ncbi:hypothetical protein VP01_15g2 [Puccinia sorghi]|uniref:Uncharacterized protein n=1 Tax=Puccinia sorghi TaxID=27349 RepID=A0A0L6VHD6_9BASI|nr:hypothetical protein VP01_15g2 [Puccinia sorghi]
MGKDEYTSTASAEAQNHLIVVKAALNASLSRFCIQNSNNPDLEVFPSAFEDSVDFYIEKLYKQHLPNKKYNTEFLFFISPFFVLSSNSIELWYPGCVEQFFTCITAVTQPKLQKTQDKFVFWVRQEKQDG